MVEQPRHRDDIVLALRKAGLRMTRQRMALIDVLAGSTDHPDAVELLNRVRRADPATSLSTVYRTLSVLETCGLIHRRSFEGAPARFEAADDGHHDHIVDLETGTVIEFYSAAIEELQNRVAAEFGYEVVHHRMELYCRRVGLGAKGPADAPTRPVAGASGADRSKSRC